MDLDHFKKVNDTYGHPTGSHTLKEIGSLIAKRPCVGPMFPPATGERSSYHT
jgi:predicted signal transduction protein with EAL and GGDEF domain